MKKRDPIPRGQRSMSEAEAMAIWEAAKNIYEPTSLGQKWEMRHDPMPSLKAFVRDLRRFGSDEMLDDPTKGAEYVGRFMEVLVKRFERLVVAGVFNEVLPKLCGLPLLYSPKAGTGAAHWQSAFNLYKAKKVGSEGALEHRGVGGTSADEPPWKELAADAVWVVQAAAEWMPALQKLRDECDLAFHYAGGRSPGKKKFHGWVYSLPDRELLVWPDWLDACQSVAALSKEGARSVPLEEGRAAYLVAVRAVMDDFFAYPFSDHAAAIVKRVKGMRAELHRSSAVAEARKHVLDVVKRM